MMMLLLQVPGINEANSDTRRLTLYSFAFAAAVNRTESIDIKHATITFDFVSGVESSGSRANSDSTSITTNKGTTPRIHNVIALFSSYNSF